jgi:hypothetical protein
MAMNTFDLLGSIQLTAGAAVVIAVLGGAFGRDIAARTRSAIVLSVWFAFVVALAATQVLHGEKGLPVLGLAVVVPVVVLAIAGLRVQSLYAALQTVPLPLLIGISAVRVMGVSFVLLHAQGRLPAPFAPAAGWGDIFVGLTAIPVAWFAYHRPTDSRLLVLVWNTIGLADLIDAVALGVLSSPGPFRQFFAEPGSGLMSTLPWLLIPAFLVPLLVTTHLAIFYRMGRYNRV